MVTRESGLDRRYGLGKSLAPLVEELSRCGLRVHYVCQEDLPAAWLRRRARWISLFAKWPHRGQTAWGMLASAWFERIQMGIFAARLAHEQCYTHVHLHDPWMGLGYWLGARKSRRAGVRWGITQHGFGSYCRATHDDGLIQGPWVQRLMQGLEARILSAADWVIAPTRLALCRLAEDLATSPIPSHWHVVPHAKPELREHDRTPARQRLGWDSECLYIIGVGRLVPLKRFDHLLECVLKLAASHPEVRLCLLGDGGQEQSLKLRARESGLAERVVFASTDDVGSYLAASDLYISVSAAESFGLANLEAICAGLPAICTSVGGVPEVLGDGAWLIDDSLDEVAEVMECLIDSPELRSVWSRKARRRAADWPTIQTIAAAYVAIYQAPEA